MITKFGAVGEANAIAIQPDGKMLITGYLYSGADRDVALIRFKEDGRIDSSFGINGVSLTDFGNNYERGMDVKLQVDGKIVITGNGGSNFISARYKANGTLDSTFGELGKIITSKGSFGMSLSILPDGKIIEAGLANAVQLPTVTNIIFLSKFKEDGSFDSSFGINGIVTKAYTNYTNSAAYSVAVDVNGKILVGATAIIRRPGSYYIYFTVSKYNSDGSVDTTFADKGELAKDSIGDDAGFSMILQKDGKILMSGPSVTSPENFKLVRYLPNGDSDSTFGIGGVVNTDLGGNDYTRLNSLEEDANGKIIVTGGSVQDSSTPLVTVRYNSDGKLDKTFGDNGKVFTKFTNGDEFANCLALQKDGKIIIAGYANDGTNQNIVLARYLVKSALPIRLSSFTAIKQNSHVLLNWQTATEINNAYFVVQRGNAGKGFADIGKVDGHGNSSITQQYSFIDNKPGTAANYYRLQQFDADNNFTYSNVISVDFSPVDKYTVYPNPVKDIFTIDNLSGNTSLTLVDADGRVVLKTVTTNKSYNCNVKSLAAGVYYLQVNGGNKTSTVKIIKQ